MHVNIFAWGRTGYLCGNHHVLDFLVSFHDLFDSGQGKLVVFEIQLTMLDILKLGLPKVAQ